MKTLTLATFTVAITALPALPALAVESTAQTPIKIVSCVVARDNSKNDAEPGPAYTNGVTAVVINTTTKTITDAQFSGVYNGVTVTDTIPGPFAPGQTYTLTKTHIRMIYDGPDASCVLNHVTYADGTTWTMPAPPVMENKS
jgi:hypothetical protein